MIPAQDLAFLVPALLRQPNWSKGLFTFRFSGEGPVETAPILVAKDGMTVALLTPLPAWVANLGPQPIDLAWRTNDADILCALEMCFQEAIAALHADSVAA
jgi:hypothetical protein